MEAHLMNYYCYILFSGGNSSRSGGPVIAPSYCCWWWRNSPRILFIHGGWCGRTSRKMESIRLAPLSSQFSLLFFPTTSRTIQCMGEGKRGLEIPSPAKNRRKKRRRGKEIKIYYVKWMVQLGTQEINSFHWFLGNLINTKDMPSIPLQSASLPLVLRSSCCFCHFHCPSGTDNLPSSTLSPYPTE